MAGFEIPRETTVEYAYYILKNDLRTKKFKTRNHEKVKKPLLISLSTLTRYVLAINEKGGGVTKTVSSS